MNFVVFRLRSLMLYFILLLFLYVVVFRFCLLQKQNKKGISTYFDSQEKFVTQLNLKNSDDDDDDDN